MKPDDAYDESELPEDELLWELGRKAPEDTTGVPLGELLAYRNGGLPRADAEEVERALAGSREARARMAELAALEPATPAPRIRATVLSSFDDAFCDGTAAARGPWLKAAAIAAIGLGMLLLLRLSQVAPAPVPLPAEVAYDVEAEGLATSRQSASRGDTIEAYPETRVRITATPRFDAAREVEFGLYRETPRRLERLEPGASFTIETVRGAAVLTALAVDLVAPATESTRLFLVAGRPGDLPPTVEPGTAGAGGALEDAGRRRAYPVVIHLRSAAP